MSTQVLYHGFGIRGYRHVRMMNQGGELVIPHSANERRVPRSRLSRGVVGISQA